MKNDVVLLGGGGDQKPGPGAYNASCAAPPPPHLRALGSCRACELRPPLRGQCLRPSTSERVAASDAQAEAGRAGLQHPGAGARRALGHPGAPASNQPVHIALPLLARPNEKTRSILIRPHPALAPPASPDLASTTWASRGRRGDGEASARRCSLDKHRRAPRSPQEDSTKDGDKGRRYGWFIHHRMRRLFS